VAALLIFLVCAGVTFYCAAVLLLAALLAVEWRWLCSPAERAVLNVRQAGSLSNAFRGAFSL
jgi:hypothetical protein